MFHKITMYCFLFSFAFSQSHQVVGKIYTKKQALETYGEVVESIRVSQKEMERYLNQSPNYLLFNFTEGNLIIADTDRNDLQHRNKTYPVEMTFHYWSTQLIVNLGSLGEEQEFQIEYREKKGNEKTLCIANGDIVLESAYVCPPFCEKIIQQFTEKNGAFSGFLYTAFQAEKVFGNVYKSLSYKSVDLENLCRQTPINISFQFDDRSLELFDANGIRLLDTNVDAKTVGRFVIQTKILANLITLGESEEVKFQIRKKGNAELFTIRNGAFVLHFTSLNSPFNELQTKEKVAVN